MAPLNALDESLYDELATQIAYCKMFPLMLEDFPTRSDVTEALNSDNLSVTTDLTVYPGQVVQTAGSAIAQTGSTVSPGSGKGSGQVLATYKVEYPEAEAIQLRADKEAIKNAGGVSGSVVGSV